MPGGCECSRVEHRDRQSRVVQHLPVRGVADLREVPARQPEVVPVVEGEQQRAAVERRAAVVAAIALPEMEREIQVETDRVALPPRPLRHGVRAGRGARRRTVVHAHRRTARPGRDPEPQLRVHWGIASDADDDRTVEGIGGLDVQAQRTAGSQRHGVDGGTEVVQHQRPALLRQRPLGQQAESPRAVDAAAVQLGAAVTGLEHDRVRARPAEAVHRRAVGRPPARGRVLAEHGVVEGEVQLVGRDRETGDVEHVHGHGHPRDGAAGLDRQGVERVAGRLLARAEAAVVVPVALQHAPPQAAERPAEPLLAGDPVQRGQRLDGVQALHRGLGMRWNGTPASASSNQSPAMGPPSGSRAANSSTICRARSRCRRSRVRS